MSPEEIAESIVVRVRTGYTPDGTAGFLNPNEIRRLIRDAIRVAVAGAQKEHSALTLSERTLEERVAELEAEVASLLKMRQYERDSDAKHSWYIEGYQAMSDQESLIHQVSRDMIDAIVATDQTASEEMIKQRVLERLDWLEAKRQEAARLLRTVFEQGDHM